MVSAIQRLDSRVSSPRIARAANDGRRVAPEPPAGRERLYGTRIVLERRAIHRHVAGQIDDGARRRLGAERYPEIARR